MSLWNECYSSLILDDMPSGQQWFVPFFIVQEHLRYVQNTLNSLILGLLFYFDKGVHTQKIPLKARICRKLAVYFLNQFLQELVLTYWYKKRQHGEPLLPKVSYLEKHYQTLCVFQNRLLQNKFEQFHWNIWHQLSQEVSFLPPFYYQMLFMFPFLQKFLIYQ